MASWLKAAEDLFEVVDRRAKLVVSELADEQSDSQSPASNGKGSQPRRTKPKAKGQRRLSANESSKVGDASGEPTSTETSQRDVVLDKDRTTVSIDNVGTPSKSTLQTTIERQLSTGKDASSIPTSEMLGNEAVKQGGDAVEVSVTAADWDTATSASNGQVSDENASDVPVEKASSLSPTEEKEVVSKDHAIDAGHNIIQRDADVPSQTDVEKSQSAMPKSPFNSETPSEDAELNADFQVNHKEEEEQKTDSEGSQKNKQKEQKADPEVNQNIKKREQKADSEVNEKDMQKEQKADSSPMKIQDPLDEAQGLLKTAISTGQSKEARLARVCAGLSTRLQEYKSENAQLEELLIAERELSKSYEDRIKQLQQDLYLSKSEVSKVESNMVEALAAKNSEIEALVNSMDAIKKQAALSEGSLASIQANMEAIMRNRELTETRMMQALREELASAERRAEEERAAHNATKIAAMEREVELEHRAVDASTALARIQRIADERTAKAAELEQKVALLEVECASLNQELQDMEARARRGQKKSPEEANQVIQIQAWQEEVERARQGQRDAESKLSSLEAELQKLRVEMAAMRRDAEHYSRQEHMELEKRYRELTDLLYYKQTQLEAMASEKAAAEFQLEKEVKRLEEAQVEAERSRVSRRPSASWEEDSEMKALEPLPLHQRQIAGASLQLQKAAKLLDSGAARATRFLWRYPTARLILLFYLVFVHLFLMYLLHRLQEQADNLSAREVAESMGLANHTLP